MYMRRYFNMRMYVTRVTIHIKYAEIIPTQCNGEYLETARKPIPIDIAIKPRTPQRVQRSPYWIDFGNIKSHFPRSFSALRMFCRA